MSHPSETGHWYSRNGESVWEVMGAAKKMVKPDIRHARKLGLLPGTTSILKCAAQPGLEIWKRDQVMLAAYTLPPIAGESGESWRARVIQDAEEHARSAAERGTAIHAAIQEACKTRIYRDHPLWDYVEAVFRALLEHCGSQGWTAEQSFAHERGYGGKVDLHCASWVLDIKGKSYEDMANPSKVLLYDEHPMQLAPYRRGLELLGARCANVFVSRDPITPDKPVLVKVIEHTEDELTRGLKLFDWLLGFWQEKNRYQSAFLRNAA